jgi:hypothetical protein
MEHTEQMRIGDVFPKVGNTAHMHFQRKGLLDLAGNILRGQEE